MSKPSASMTEMDEKNPQPVRDNLPLALMDRIVRLAAKGFDVPYVLISLYNGRRHSVVAYHGPKWLEQMPDMLFCMSRTVRKPGLIVPDLRQDPWSAHSPAVTGEQGIRFYMGVPIFHEKTRVGVLCLLDRDLHDEFGESELRLLGEQAGMIEESLILEGGSVLRENYSTANGQPVSWLLPFFNLPLVDLDEKPSLVLRVMQIFQLVMDNSPQAVFWKDTNSTYFWCNQRFAKDVGIDYPQRVFGKTDFDLGYSKEQAEFFRQVDQRLLQSGNPELHSVSQQTRPDGKVVWLETNRVPIFDVNGNIVGILGTYEDITERKQAEEALRSSQQMLQIVFDNIPQSVFWKDRHSNFQGGNRAFILNTGLARPEELLGKSDYDMPWPKDQVVAFVRDDQWVMANDTPKYHIIEPQTRIDGKIAWLDTNKIPLHDAQGNVVGVIGTYEDITNRKEAEEALRRAHDQLEARVKERTNELSNANAQLMQEIHERERAEAKLRLSQERYALAVNAGQVGVFEWNVQEDELYLDPSLKALLGVNEPEENTSLDVWMQSVHPADQPVVKAALRRFLTTDEADYEQEYRIVFADGQTHWVLARGSTLFDERGRPARKNGSLTDITALKIVEEALRRRDQILEALTFVSQQLLMPEGLETGLNNVLNQLAQAIGFHRAYILKNSGESAADLRAVHYALWAEEGLALPAVIDFHYNDVGIAAWAAQLQENTPVTGTRSDFSIQEQHLFNSLGVESLAWVPILVEREWWGVLGFDLKGSERRCMPAEVEALKTAASTLGAAFAQQRIRDAEREQRNMAEALRDIAALLNSTLSLDGVLDRILSEIGRVVPHDTATIIMVDKNKARQVRYYGERIQVDTIGENDVFLIDEYPSLRSMVNSREPLILEDTANSPLWVTKPHLRWVRSYLGAPITLEGEVIGFINLNSARPAFFSAIHSERLQAFANQAASAIQNARMYEQAQELAALEERQRLARDLHDAVSQTLWTASITAEVLPDLWERDREEGRNSLNRLRRLTQGALAEMRTLLLELRPGALVRAGLDELLEQLAQATMSRKKLNISLQINGRCTIPPDVQVGIYRIAQEALNNVAKHSRATEVKMVLESSAGGVELKIMDNGHGFNQENIPPERLGMHIMHERAAAIHADLQIDSVIHQGTQIRVAWKNPTIPVSRQEVS